MLSLVVTQNGGVFTLDGFDDQCGTTTRAPVTGLATPNPNGTIEFGLTVVATPSAAPVHVAAVINPATLSGTWQDSATASGNFVFTPGAGTGGSPRPLTGTIGGLSVNPSQVQLRISGSCPSGTFMQSVTEIGSVSCAFGGDLIGLSAGLGLAGGGTSGTVALSLRQTSKEFHAAFGLGEDALRIGSMDADGVALRAIQALEARTRVADERRGALEAEVAGLLERLATLERLLAERR